ncbi:hypothetical protein M8J77_025931 [Diaphorina citri]|nr:hypothetical protein M8J77_025931 [Diaphorina citri]
MGLSNPSDPYIHWIRPPETDTKNINSPLCVVSKSRFLTSEGWTDIGNRSLDFESPFKLHKDHNQVYLKWMGDTELRHEMEGRLVLVNLMCKTKETKISTTPCIAFRIAGTPSIKEVSFSPSSADAPAFDQSASSIWDYLSLGSVAVILGLIYSASVALYLMHKKRNATSAAPGGEEGKHGDKMAVLSKTETMDERIGRVVPEEGMIKSNPLLHHCHDNGGYISDEFTNESDQDEVDMETSNNINHFQLTSAIIHPSHPDDLYSTDHYQTQDPLSNEKLPEENVSIVETMEKDETPPETVRAMACGNARRKLYFNPAYFEHDLLIQPPAAAIEFLIKIREVIAIAKQKMSAKKYLPSLINIPEEETLVIPKPSLRPSDMFETSTYERYQAGSLNPPSKINADELNFQFFDHDGTGPGKDCFYSNNEPNCLINEQNNEFIYNKYRQDWNYNKELENEELRSNTSYKEELLSHRSNRSNKQDTLRSNHSREDTLERYKDNASYRDEVCSHRSYRDEMRSQCSHRSNRDDLRSNCSQRSNRDELKSNHSYKDELLSQRHELRSNCSHRSGREDARSSCSYKEEILSVRSQKSQQDEVRSNFSGRDRRHEDSRSLNHTSCNSFKCNCHCSKQRPGGGQPKPKCSEFSFNFTKEDRKLPSSRKSTHSEMISHDKESVQSFRSLCHNDKCTRRTAAPLSTPTKPPVAHTKQDSIHKWLQNIDVNRNQIVDMKDEIDQSIETKPFIKPTRNKEKFNNYKKQKAPSPPKQIQDQKTKDCVVDIDDASVKSNETLDMKINSRLAQNFRGRGDIPSENSEDEDGQIYEDNTTFNKTAKNTKAADTVQTNKPDDKSKVPRIPNFSLLHRTNSMSSNTNKSDIVETSSTKSNPTKNSQSNPTKSSKPNTQHSSQQSTNDSADQNSPKMPKLPNFKLNKSQLHSMMRSLGSLGPTPTLDHDGDRDSLEKSLYEQQIYQESESIRTPSDYDDIVKDITAIPAIRKHFNNLQYDEHDYEIVGNKNAATPAEAKDAPVRTPTETPDKFKPDEAPLKGASMEEFIKQNEGYSLISEIYINDSYNMHSSLTNSTSSLSDVTDEKHGVSEDQRIKINAREGHLTIELEDDPKDYPIVTENFEPDTLDRKDLNNNRQDDVTSVSDIYMDSLERTPMNTKRLVKNNLKTLRNIFEFNSKMLTGKEERAPKQFNGSDVPPPNSLLSYNFIPKPPFDIHSDDDGAGSDTDYSQLSWCTSSEKQSKFTKRQRPPSPPLLTTLSQTNPQTPPKLPPRNNASHDYYEFSMPSKNPMPEIVPPLPPRTIKPPLPPKNSKHRSTDLRKFMNRPLPDLPEDIVGASVNQNTDKQEIYMAVDDNEASGKQNSSVFETRPESPQTKTDHNIYNEIKTDVLAPSGVSNGFEFNNQKNLTPFEIFQLKRSRKLVRKPSDDSQLDGSEAKTKDMERPVNSRDATVKSGTFGKQDTKKDVSQTKELSIKDQMNKVLQEITAKGNTFNKSQKKEEEQTPPAPDKEQAEEPYYNVRSIGSEPELDPSPPEKDTNNKTGKTSNRPSNGSLKSDNISSVRNTKNDCANKQNHIYKGHSSSPSSPASSFNEFYENKTFLNDAQNVRTNSLGIKSFRKLSESSEYEFILPRNKHDSNVIIRHKSKHGNLKPNNDSGYLSTSTSSGSETDDNVNLDSDFSNDNESTSTNFQFYKH